jgi:hypothetical protein
MVYDHNLQATHCAEPRAWDWPLALTEGDRWWAVWSCPDHREGLTGLRE